MTLYLRTMKATSNGTIGGNYSAGEWPMSALDTIVLKSITLCNGGDITSGPKKEQEAAQGCCTLNNGTWKSH